MSRKEVKSSRTPVYRDSGFILENASEMSEAFMMENENEREPHHYIYSRYRNPTVVEAEEHIMKEEGSNWALLTQSGMSAIDVALSVFHRGKSTGKWLFFTEIYGGTISYINSVLIARRGIETEIYSPCKEKYDLSLLEKIILKSSPDFLYFETVSNPMLIVADGNEIISLCKKHGVKVIVDNTFATPLLWRPLDYGADMVIHSATKYFSGHGNLTAGVVCGNDNEIMKAAIEYRKFTGHMISPDDAYRLTTQIQSFRLRYRQQCDNAFKLAELLNRHELTEKVWYPGLKSHITNSTAVKMFENRGFGAMVTFSFAGRDESTKMRQRDAFLAAVSDNIKLIPTLGDPHTIMMPVEPVWGDRYPDKGMIRISAGFEEWEILEATVNSGLDSLV